MASYGKEVAAGDRVATFRRVVGGELPLSNEIAALWLEGDENDIRAARTLCEMYGGDSDCARWLRYGRSALGLALDLCGVGPNNAIALPAYQCCTVFDKASSRCRWRTYPLDDRLAPDLRALLERSRNDKAVVTCVYFGSATIEEKLTEVGNALAALPRQPWIIEDRVMCFPDPVLVPLSQGRCDFALISFRKHYPVPDGALLVACSDRARERLFEWSKKIPGDRVAAPNPAIRPKVLAKAKRHAWLSLLPLVDDPGRNGVNESVTSEAALDAAAALPDSDSWPGTTASARFLLGCDFAGDAGRVRAMSRIVVEGLLAAQIPQVALNLRDCGGIGVPLLLESRNAFRAKAAAAGVFLPAHWPVSNAAAICPSVRSWYEQEVTVPVMPSYGADDITFLLGTLIEILQQ